MDKRNVTKSIYGKRECQWWWWWGWMSLRHKRWLGRKSGQMWGRDYVVTCQLFPLNIGFQPLHFYLHPTPALYTHMHLLCWTFGCKIPRVEWDAFNLNQHKLSEHGPAMALLPLHGFTVTDAYEKGDRSFLAVCTTYTCAPNCFGARLLSSNGLLGGRPFSWSQGEGQRKQMVPRKSSLHKFVSLDFVPKGGGGIPNLIKMDQVGWKANKTKRSGRVYHGQANQFDIRTWIHTWMGRNIRQWPCGHNSANVVNIEKHMQNKHDSCCCPL